MHKRPIPSGKLAGPALSPRARAMGPNFFPALIALVLLALPGRAAVILDDTWADGTRTNTALPNESAWFASSSASLTATTNSMTGALGTTSRTWWTYFTTNASG